MKKKLKALWKAVMNNKAKKTIPAPTLSPTVATQYARHITEMKAYKFYEWDCLGQGFSIAALDGGMAHHEQWKDSTPHIIRRSFVKDSPDPFKDPTGHGTHIASLLIGGKPTKQGQVCVGLAPKVENYYHFKCMSDNGNIVLDDVDKALQALIDLGGIRPDFCNLSFGEYFEEPYADDIKSINAKIAKLVELGVIFFNAAGNHSSDKISWLSKLPGVVSVSAIGFNKQLGYLSNYGDQIDLAGYGIGIQGYHKSGTGYLVADGSSQSSPIDMAFCVAAASYFVRQKRLLKDWVKKNLFKLMAEYGMIEDLFTPGTDIYSGIGLCRLS